jgi:amidase
MKFPNIPRLGALAALSALALQAPLTTARAEVVAFNLETATLDDVQAAMEAKALTSVSLTRLYLKRIDAYSDFGPQLNAVPFINPGALEEAAAMDELRAGGTVLSPIHGVPFVVKWSYGVKDQALTGGLTGWQDLYSPTDSPVVARLKEKGGVFLGYANMSTFAISATTSSSGIAGSTYNAYVSGYVPGGSSGGSGVAAGANLAFFSFGGETGGSIRNPSDRSGVVGFKPSVGVVPIGNILALVPNRDVIGPMTRYTIDNAKIMDLVSWADPTDIWYPVKPVLTDRPEPTGFQSKLLTSLAGKRIGIINTYIGITNTEYTGNSDITGRTTTTAEVTGIFNQAVADLQALGAEIKYVNLSPDTSSDTARPAGQPARRLYETPYIDQSKAYAHYNLLAPLVALPGDTAAQVTAKVIARADQTLSNHISAAQKEDITQGNYTTFTDAQGTEHFQSTRDILEDFDAWMALKGIDLLIWPTSGSKSSTSQTYAGNDPVNYLGNPLVTVPMGRLATGEPQTLAFSGRLNEDAEILAAAHAYEQYSKKRYASPMVPPLQGESFLYDNSPVTPPAEPGPVVSLSSEVLLRGSTAKKMLFYTVNVAVPADCKVLEVTIDGVKVPAKAKAKVQLTIDAAPYRTRAQTGVTTTDVIIYAEDFDGNTSAYNASLALPVSYLLSWTNSP